MSTGTATATAGFTLERTSAGWGHLHHAQCGKWTSFVEPTDERVQWYVATHRCGPEDTEWHISQAATDGHRTESPVATATWMRSVSRYLGIRPPELFESPTVWPALQELAQTIDDLYPTGLQSRRSE